MMAVGRHVEDDGRGKAAAIEPAVRNELELGVRN